MFSSQAQSFRSVQKRYRTAKNFPFYLKRHHNGSQQTRVIPTVRNKRAHATSCWLSQDLSPFGSQIRVPKHENFRPQGSAPRDVNAPRAPQSEAYRSCQPMHVLSFGEGRSVVLFGLFWPGSGGFPHSRVWQLLQVHDGKCVVVASQPVKPPT